ncbi:MAG: hypothetical protein AB1424_14400 [Thermodesulfobacteriota bacterium]
MKAEPSLKVVRGQAASGKRTRRPKGQIPHAPPEVVSLISSENERASRLDPHSLEEAHHLLEQLLFQVEQGKGNLEEVHRVQNQCLVRLW